MKALYVSNEIKIDRLLTYVKWVNISEWQILSCPGFGYNMGKWGDRVVTLNYYKNT